MSELLEVVHASVSDEIKHHTLELPHPTFPNGVFRWVQGFDDELLGLEDGSIVTFEQMPFGVSLPDCSMRGNQDLQFQLDNVTGEVLGYIRSVLNSGEKLPVIYRPYLSSNKAAPEEVAIEMTATSFTADMLSVNIIADFHDFVNKLWPVLRYTPALAPGLKYA
tara:strand:+ start:31996 stop:32487 length:492 start_codon:yes stop_codon:yes gene_type:complete